MGERAEQEVLHDSGMVEEFLWKATPLTEKDTVVLADFINSTGDPVFDGTHFAA